MTSTYSFPFGIYCGDLIDNNDIHKPLLLPEETGGFCVLFDSDKEEESNSFIENVTLQLLDVIAKQKLEINIFDYSIRKRFSYLSSFKSDGLYKILNKSKFSNDQFAELEDIAFKRHDELLSSKNRTISIYNKESKFPEIYYLLIINLEDFPDDFTSDKRFIELISAAHEAGIYIIAFGNKEILSTKKKAIKHILTQYPVIEMFGDDVVLKPHNKVTSLIDLMAKYKFKIKLLNEDRDTITEKILEKLQKDITNDMEKDFLSVPIGTSPDGRKIIHFKLGKQSESYNAFIVGMAGTGKTTLLNNIILEIAKQYTSEEVELYLMDYKEGVEFQVFKGHPNCKKIFLDNEDLLAATNLLNEFQNTMRERSELFKEAEVPDIDKYNTLSNAKVVPRLILIIDEVHRLFSGSFKEKEQFSKLLEDIARRGRGFGVHLILSTQTIVGTDINSQTMAQIPLRIAYKLNSDLDTEKIFGYGNKAPLKLKKYELIYNNESGNKEANITCRVNAPTDIKTTIDEVRDMRDKSLCLTPIVVSSSDVEKREKEGVPQTPWKFDPVNPQEDKYNTRTEKDLLKVLKQKGIEPEVFKE